ncbi:MFS transporter [Streptomyces sp. MS1.HAVA.3]|uniref:MFS transporter n=1 Tax=Streptomyces caledonius TaxID=3134107 RepID=A0ABU8U3N1_9ACTN
MSQFGSFLLVAHTSGSLATAGMVGGALSLGQVLFGPVLGLLADRHGQRPVVLAAAAVNAVATAALVAGRSPTSRPSRSPRSAPSPAPPSR